MSGPPPSEVRFIGFGDEGPTGAVQRVRELLAAAHDAIVPRPHAPDGAADAPSMAVGDQLQSICDDLGGIAQRLRAPGADPAAAAAALDHLRARLTEFRRDGAAMPDSPLD